MFSHFAVYLVSHCAVYFTMWNKLYISIIVITVLILLQTINIFVSSIDSKYLLQQNYGAPIKCLSTVVCGISGNIILLWIVYLIIPNSYYDEMLSALDPRSMHKSVERDVFGINKYLNADPVAGDKTKN